MERKVCEWVQVQNQVILNWFATLLAVVISVLKELIRGFLGPLLCQITINRSKNRYLKVLETKPIYFGLIYNFSEFCVKNHEILTEILFYAILIRKNNKLTENDIRNI